MVIKKKPTFDPNRKSITQGASSFSVSMSKLSSQEKKIIEDILLNYIKHNYAPAQRATSIILSPKQGYYNEVSINGYYSSVRQENDVEFKKRQEKYEKEVTTYNNWLKKNTEKIQNALEARQQELEQIQQDIDEIILVEQYIQ